MPPVTRTRKRPYSVLRRIRRVRVRRYGQYWCADGCAQSMRTPGAAAWLHEFLNS